LQMQGPWPFAFLTYFRKKCSFINEINFKGGDAMIEVIYERSGCKDVRIFRDKEEFDEWKACMDQLKQKFGDEYRIVSEKEKLKKEEA